MKTILFYSIISWSTLGVQLALAQNQLVLPDSLTTEHGSLSTRFTEIKQQGDSLSQTLLDAHENKLKQTDSLLQENRIVEQVDSSSQKLESTRQSVNQKIDSLRQSGDVDDHIHEATQKIQQDVDQPEAIQGTKKALNTVEQNTGLDTTPNVAGLPNAGITQQLPEVPKLAPLPHADLSEVNIPGIEIPEVSVPAIDISVKDWADLPAKVPSLPDATIVEKTAEKQFSKLGEAKELKKQQQLLEKTKELPELYQKQGERFRDQNHWRSQAQEQAVKVFSSQSEKLEDAKTSLAKLKRKYKTVQTDQDIYVKKSSLKGDSLKTRIAAGFTLQIHQEPSTAFDLSPFMGFCWNKNWVTGLGGTYRLAFTPDHRINAQEPVYGGRIFVQWLVNKSFLVHLEAEALRAWVPNFAPNEKERYWVESLLFGVGKQYTITDKIKGNVLYLHTFPYMPFGPYQVKHQVRFGFILR